MDLSRATLTQITCEEYTRLHLKHDPVKREFSQAHSYAQIVTPLQYPSYASLIADLENENPSTVLSVNDQGTWRRFKKWDMPDVSEIERLAKADRLIKGHLEIVLKWGDDKMQLSFLEKEGIVISYKLRFNSYHYHAFDWTTTPKLKHGRVLSLWVPTNT